MIEWIKNITIRKFYILKLWNDKKEGYLYKSGWIKSFEEKKPVDLQGNPQPWLSLPANQFLEDRWQSHFKVFEYGSGFSTLYLSPKVKSITAVEHDKSWFSIMQKNLLPNIKLKFVKLDETYQSCIKEEETNFHIITIDGRHRIECAKQSIKSLETDGVVIFDDSDRAKYKEAFTIYENEGFKKLDFWGLGLGSIRQKCTTIFYKDNNCLNI